MFQGLLAGKDSRVRAKMRPGLALLCNNLMREGLAHAREDETPAGFSYNGTKPRPES